ncbi:MAG: hypothetical protein ACYTFY_15645, partial [Planctomycetota bacterium]
AVTGAPSSVIREVNSKDKSVLNIFGSTTSKGRPSQVYTKPEVTDLKGNIEDFHLIVPNIDIESPHGDPTVGKTLGTDDDHELANTSNELIFDDQKPAGEKAGECMFDLISMNFAGLSNDNIKKLVSDRLKWNIDSIGSGAKAIAPSFNPITKIGKKVTVTYKGMPEKYSDFGMKGIKLSFVGNEKWNWHQDAEFFFDKTGKSKSGNDKPNWFIYWSQLGEPFGFAPVCTKVTYSSDFCREHKDEKDVKPNEKITMGYYNNRFYNYIGHIEEEMTIYDVNKKSVYRFLRTSHHENGHRASRQLANIKGGWGKNLQYDYRKDIDRDGIHDDFENAIEDDVFTAGLEPKHNNTKEHSDWDHGILGGYDKESGRALPIHYETLVEKKEKEIEEADWSTGGLNYHSKP